MNDNITPFERARLSVHMFSYGLSNDYIFQSLLPMIERISRLYDKSVESGDEDSALIYKNTRDLLLSTVPSIDVGA